jgi:hypothetical protein
LIQSTLIRNRDTYVFFLREARKLADLLSKRDDLGEQVEKMREIAMSRFGPMPPIEDIKVEL